MNCNLAVVAAEHLVNTLLFIYLTEETNYRNYDQT